MSSSDQIPIPISISISIPNLIPIPGPADNETDDFNGFHDAKL